MVSNEVSFSNDFLLLPTSFVLQCLYILPLTLEKTLCLNLCFKGTNSAKSNVPIVCCLLLEVEPNELCCYVLKSKTGANLRETILEFPGFGVIVEYVFSAEKNMEKLILVVVIRTSCNGSLVLTFTNYSLAALQLEKKIRREQHSSSK